jgi:hypothetical protein
MTAPTLNLTRALDDHAPASLDALDTEIRETVETLRALYRQRAELQALADIRAAFSREKQ